MDVQWSSTSANEIMMQSCPVEEAESFYEKTK